jgi:hypothetical protein
MRRPWLEAPLSVLKDILCMSNRTKKYALIHGKILELEKF